MRRPRVLVVSSSATLYGADRMVLESVRGMRERGWPVVVALPTDGPLIEALTELGATVVHCPTPILRRRVLTPAGAVEFVRDAVGSIGPSLRLLRGRPDIVLVNTVVLPMWLLLGRLGGARVVAHVHEAEVYARRIVSHGLLLPVALAHTPVVNSEFTRGVLRGSLPRTAARSVLVPNGVPGPDEPTLPRPEPTGSLHVLYVGRLSARKGVQVAMAATRILGRSGTPACLTVVGDVFAGNEPFEAELRHTYRAEIEAGTVRMVGFQSPIWPWIAESDVVVVPSTENESFGNTAAEAVLAGRPVVVSAIGALPEVIGGLESALVVPPGDAEALAEALRQAHANLPSLTEAATRSAAEGRRRYAPALYRQRICQAIIGA